MKVVALCPELTPTIVARNARALSPISMGVPHTNRESLRQTPVFQYWPLPGPLRLSLARPSIVLNSNRPHTNVWASPVNCMGTLLPCSLCLRPSHR